MWCVPQSSPSGLQRIQQVPFRCGHAREVSPGSNVQINCCDSNIKLLPSGRAQGGRIELDCLSLTCAVHFEVSSIAASCTNCIDRHIDSWFKAFKYQHIKILRQAIKFFYHNIQSGFVSYVMNDNETKAGFKWTTLYSTWWILSSRFQ